jgi:hypothetical protein
VSAARQEISAALVRDLVGPADGIEESLERRPSEHYLAGAVYPIGFRGNEISQEEEDPLQQTSKFFPSAIGLTVLVNRNARLTIEGTCASYSEVGSQWRRKGHSKTLEFDMGEIIQRRNYQVQFDDLRHAHIAVTVRSLEGDGNVLVTAMLTNRNIAGSGLSDQLILFQAGLTIEASESLVILSGNDNTGLADEEPLHLGDDEQDLQFLYRDSAPLAHGHGVSVDWAADRRRVWTVVLPQVLVHGLRSDPERFSKLDLRIDNLIGTKGLAPIGSMLDMYADWIAELSKRLASFAKDGRYAAATQRIIERHTQCHSRMQAGMDRLSSDPQARAAWDLALESMQLQFQRPALTRSQEISAPSLRSFQVAYALLILPGLGAGGVHDASREIVDLLWFPTGGGKTEAYIFVLLIEAFSRRLANPNDAGCVALSRYTYRMLAFDQFSRAASAICAAEVVRKKHLERLGTFRFSVGLWIGSSQTPNKIHDIDNAYGDQPRWRDRWIKNEPSFPIVTCPWCGHTLRFTSDYLSADSANQEFVLWCTNRAECPFGDQSGSGLPLSVVDDHIYQTLPTVVVATTDKLAQLPVWSDDEGPALLRGRGECQPVSILLFDELHLLSGPLGTLAALYEIATDAIVEGATRGRIRPKILASTATIRTAGTQTKGLLGRSLATFPVSGDNPDDSFWAVKDDRSETARLYVGAMTSGSTWQALYVYVQTSIFRSVAKLPAEERNPYWTSVVYAGTLRDHGRAVTLIANDVRSRIAQLDDINGREIKHIEELRGDRVGSRLPQVLALLKRDYVEADNPAIDAVVTTNLIQVGVDVPRLGLMLMLGQPKGTAEYIQASSRVGRTASSSGIVITLFQHTRPRDRSHYELFKSYHEALYRSVEPISVTPTAEPALERSLRAVFAAVARHAGGGHRRSDARGVGLDLDWLHEARQIIWNALIARDDGIGSSANLDALLHRLVGEWHLRASSSAALMWADRSRDLPHVPMLLAPRLPPIEGPEWPYDYSMRNVEASVTVPIGSVRLRVREVQDGE